MTTRTRRLGDGDYEVLQDGKVVGRVRRTTPPHVTFSARWEALSAAGQRIASGCVSRARAIQRLLEEV